MPHSYRITVEPQSSRQDEAFTFEADSHDDLLEIIERIRAKNLLPPDQIESFCVGLKLFGGVMLKNRKDPLFADFGTAFGDFMKKLKSS